MALRLNFVFERNLFAAQLAHELAVGGLTVVDAIERFLSEWLEDSISQSLGGRIVKAPRSVVHPMYNVDRFQNLAGLSRGGYSTWYPEVRFSTGKDDVFDITHLHVSGFELGSISYGDGVERQYTHRVKELKTQVNHIMRLNEIRIPPNVFAQTIREVNKNHEIAQPYIANMTVGIEYFVDDRIAGFRTVSFDQIVTGERKFCKCHSDAHTAMLLDAKARLPDFAPDSWPHRVVALLEHASYAEGLCHFCVADEHGKDAPLEWYGTQIRNNFQPYVDVLVRSTDMDGRTARAEARRRLSISRWVREEELYEFICGLFPNRTIRREASPAWLGRQRLDIYLPELALSVEHQGEQHYFPIEAFGGEHAFEETRRRDQRKRALCCENGVTVVDIRFDDPLTTPSLRNRLQRWLPR